MNHSSPDPSLLEDVLFELWPLLVQKEGQMDLKKNLKKFAVEPDYLDLDEEPELVAVHMELVH